MAGARPWLLRHSPEVILVMIVFVNMGRTTDPDLWGHIRYGQAMLSAGHLILHDPYSYSAAGHEWRDHEWLSEIIMALLYDRSGVIGLKLWRLACTAGTLAFMTLGLAETEALPSVQLCALGSVPIAIGPADFRPQLFTFLLFAVMLALLARDTYRGPAPLWAAIPVMALWSNLHGGFVVGVAMLVLYAGTCAVRDLVADLGFGHSFRLTLIAGAATLATFVTPHPGITWGAVIHALKNPLTHRVIEDWQPLTAVVLSGWQLSYWYLLFPLFALALTAGLAITFFLTPQIQDLPLVAIAAIMSTAGFVAVRNVPLAAMACAIPIARHAHLRLRAHAAEAERYGDSQRRRSLTWYIVVAAGLISLTLKGRLFSNRLVTDQAYPLGAVAFMERHHLHGNVLGDYTWGQYLIWHTAPASKLFVDGRYDTVYPLQVLQDYIAFYFNLPGAAQVLRSYPHDFVLIPPTAEAHTLMEKEPGWKLIYSDQDCVLYARDGSGAAKLEDIPFAGKVSAIQYFP